MNLSELKPGTWANINTFAYLCDSEEVVQNPVFMISREEYSNRDNTTRRVFMFVDQGKNLLILRQEGTSFELSGLPISKLAFNVSIKSIFVHCVLKESDRAILPCAEEHRRQFLINHPDMEGGFFKPSEKDLKY